MGQKQECEMLRGCPVFSGLPDSKLKLLSFTSELVSLQAGEIFINQGEVGDSCFMIMDGFVNIIRNGSVVAFLGPGKIVGEVALLHNGIRTASCQAETEVKALKIDKETFFVLLEDNKFARHVLRILASRLSE